MSESIVSLNLNLRDWARGRNLVILLAVFLGGAVTSMCFQVYTYNQEGAEGKAVVDTGPLSPPDWYSTCINCLFI